MKKILWVDDEIELLRSHIIFLSEKGYDVDTVTNGEDAVSSVKEKPYDLIFLDEMMAGMGGLETLGKIKEINSAIPVVMVTKNEEETLMNEAIGGKIRDYLTKPVNPSQILLVCKKILEGRKISGEYAAKDYLQDFNEISRQMMLGPDFDEWIELYLKLVGWDVELDVLAYSPSDQRLIHIETSGDANSWQERKERFLKKKFILSHKEYELLIGSSVKQIEKIAIVGWSPTRNDLNWRDDIKVVLIPQLLEKITTKLKETSPLKQAVPESFPLLRAMQMVLAFGKK